MKTSRLSVVWSKRHEAWCSCVGGCGRSDAMETVAGIEMGPPRTAAMGGTSKGFATTVTAALHRAASSAYAYATALCLMSFDPTTSD
ncbi:hypothetical protein RB195_008973 [Necator americanus]